MPFFILNFVSANFYQKFYSLISFLYIAYLSILWLGLFYNLMIYSLTTFIVTNKRIIKIEEKGFFNYERSELELDKIQDITVNILGLWAGFLNFGDILIQTAGAETKFIMKSLPKPLKIKDEILKIKKQP